ncbi:hypothetical protein CYMTET_53803 [Cymbomonas tetramitiformis]|uniref:Uncharacterized protein n=1 Tax=Cymbomonas tetramitiformis TaxID=36881 RepID=A0AAE0ERD3_9CHLO|nr:hypothetical protein CYMTET_53803 [Cymbomonas tetramitiformis]
MVKKWSTLVDDANKEDIKSQDMPEIVIKFIPYKDVVEERMSDREVFDSILHKGDVEWLENYDSFQYMAIFFVLNQDRALDEDDADDMDDEVGVYQTSTYKEFINDVLIYIIEENRKRFEATYNAHLKGKDKQGMMTAKRMLPKFHNLSDSHLEITGNRLSSEHCIDLSWVQTSAEDMYKLFQSFLTCHKQIYCDARITDTQITLESLFTPTLAYEEKVRECSERYEDIHWRRLLVSADSGNSYSWNLNAPFVLRVGESDFTMVSWEHTVQPQFKYPQQRIVEEFFDAEAIEEEEEGEASNAEEVTDMEHDKECMDQQLREDWSIAMASSSDDESAPDEGQNLMLVSKRNMSKRSFAQYCENVDKRSHNTPKRTPQYADAGPASRNERSMGIDQTGPERCLSYGVFDPEGLIGNSIRIHREFGLFCSPSGFQVARIVLERYWMNFSNNMKQRSIAEQQEARQSKVRSLLINFFMCVACPRTTAFKLVFPMSDALAYGLKPFFDVLDESKYKMGRERKTLQVAGLPYNHERLTIGMQYVIDWWAYLDKAIHMECLHYLGTMLHLCFTSVYATPFDEYKRLPHVWMSGLHSVGKSFVVLNVADVSLPECMIEKVHRETQGACYISTMNNVEQLTTYKAKIFTETPLDAMGISKYAKATDANANLKARMVGEDVALKRSYRNEQTNQYELEMLNPKIRELMVFVMNQPLYEVEPNVFTRGIPSNPSRLNRVEMDLSSAAHETPCHKTLGGIYPISSSDEEETFEREELQKTRSDSTKEIGKYGNVQAQCEGNLRSRLFFFGAMYQAAVRMRILRGVDMLEVRGRHNSFSKALQKIPLVTRDKLNRRLEDISSIAYTLTSHAAIWKVFASADSPFINMHEFDASMLEEVDKHAVCSSSIALFSFSSVAKALINEPMRMMLFYARYELLSISEEDRQHPARETTPIENVNDTYLFDNDYYILSNTFHPKTPCPSKGISKADAIVQDHFIRRMLLFYQTPANVRRYGKDTMTIEYAKSLLMEFINTELFCIRDCIETDKVQRVMCVNKNYIKLDGYTVRNARVSDDCLTVKDLICDCFDANTRCQRLLLCDAANAQRSDGDEETWVPQLPQHIDIPLHANNCPCSAFAAGENEELPVLNGIVDPGLKCRGDEGCTCFRSSLPVYPDGTVNRKDACKPLEDVAFDRRMVDLDLIDRIPETAEDERVQRYNALIKQYHPTLCSKTVEKRDIDTDDKFYPTSDIDLIIRSRGRGNICLTGGTPSSSAVEWKSCMIAT